MDNIPPPETLFSPLVEHAAELAAQWHDGTYRKSVWRDPAFEVPDTEVVQVPVISHLAAVASIVRRAGWDDTVVAAAYLHDAIEDANRYGRRLRRTQLRDAMGPEVTALVARVSEKKLDATGDMRPWRDRKEGYLDSLRAGPPPAMGISLADKIHNLWSITQSLEAGEDILEMLSGDGETQLWFHRAVLEVSTHHDDPRLVPMRERLENEIDRLAAHVEDGNAAP